VALAVTDAVREIVAVCEGVCDGVGPVVPVADGVCVTEGVTLAVLVTVYRHRGGLRTTLRNRGATRQRASARRRL